MRKARLNLLILLTLIGLGVSLYLTIQHFALLTKGFQGPSFCSFSEKFDCDAVMMSSFSKLGPFPVGGLGLVYFFYLLLPLLYVRIFSDASKSLLVFPLLSTFPALLLILYLAAVSTLILKTWCILCISLYLITAGIFLLFPSAINLSFSNIGTFFMNYFKSIFGKNSSLGFIPNFFGNFLYALVVIAIGLFILYGNQSKYAADVEDFDHQAFLDFHYIQKPIPPLDTTGRPLWGKADAPVTLIEFSDFECPFCKKAALNLKPRLKEYQNQVQFFFFNYPLDKNCNPYMQRDLHEHACDAAKAVLCAQKQGKFWPYHDLLFAHQPRFSSDELREYAKRVGLNLTDFESCLQSEETQAKILADIEAGKTAGVQGTPAVYINGRTLKEWLNPVMLKLVIEEELKRAKKAK